CAISGWYERGFYFDYW
nr:immunoglobulin heavy chain junction region [Macaca mulatta]MOX14480.1 immunoglobulin heavy chain junction region [Macaca mulatta]MOX14487.1 immunoglobulin heavy chain junction region [Macaca mulatta]MOX14490.1 immunoglobulin heavy chain junction region [Macaca mulatta]MOX14504.1 immunoglobulin heavy chain junction region [Macaca mulatta]